MECVDCGHNQGMDRRVFSPSCGWHTARLCDFCVELRQEDGATVLSASEAEARHAAAIENQI